MATWKLACFWPGLLATWHRGLARGLLVATLFAWFFCLLMLATFVWPHWLARSFVHAGWSAFALSWLAFTAHGLWSSGGLLATTSADASEALARAQTEYIRGNWFDAEAILLEVVHEHPRDAEALLLLVGVLRHTRRWQPALRRLEQLELLDTAAPWHFEIEHERRLIQREQTQHTEAEEE